MKPLAIHSLVLGVLLLIVMLSIFTGTSGGHQATAAAWAVGVLYIGGAYLGYVIISSFVYVVVSKRSFLTPTRVIVLHIACFAGIYCVIYVVVEIL